MSKYTLISLGHFE